MEFHIIAFILGAFVVMWLDIFWWTIDYKKVEKGLEWHEHYHVGLELITLGIFVSIFHGVAASALFGAGFLFLVAEWRQQFEHVGQVVKVGHPFAYGSIHFKASTIFGIVLTGFLVISYLYLSPLVEQLI